MTRRTVLAVMLLLAATVLVSAGIDSDAQTTPAAGTGTDSGTQETTIKIDEDTVLVASGNCGAEAGAASWTYNRGSSTSSLDIASGVVKAVSSWTISYVKIGEKELTATEIDQYDADDLFKDRVVLTTYGSVSAEKGIIAGLHPTSAVISEGMTSIPASFFSNCQYLSGVTISKDVTSIGAAAFEGCTLLSKVDVMNAEVDQTAFKGCTRLIELKASGSQAKYTSENGFLFSDGWKTLYMCPTGKTGKVSLSQIKTATRIYLNYADVDYILDVKGKDDDYNIVFADAAGLKATDIKSRGFVYSSLGMEKCNVSAAADSFTISYSLYKGWDMPDDGKYVNAVAKFDEGSITLKFKDSSLWMTAYPMGVKTLTYDDLRKTTDIGGWTVSVSNMPEGKGIVEAIEPLSASVTGYNGSGASASLDGVMHIHGVRCVITSVSLSAQTAGKLEDLTIGEGIAVGESAFANLAGLKSVEANHVDSVGAGAFRYCTNLRSASFSSCTSFGEYAFESCWSLSTIGLGSGDVVFGQDSLRGCRSLELLTVGMDAKVSGAEDVSVLHYDMSDTSEKTFEVSGDYVKISWSFSSRLEYSESSDRSTAVSQDCYSNSYTIIPLYKEMYVWRNAGPSPPEASGRNLVMFDYGLDLEDKSVVVLFDKCVSKPEDPSAWGYKFAYWTEDGSGPFDFTTPIKECTILKAVWYKEDAVDTTPMILGGIFAAAVIATFVVLALARRMSD